MDGLIIEQSAAGVHKKGAEILRHVVRERSVRGETTAIALSGGSTPLGMYRLLAREPYRSELPWNDVHLFWVDERCVPPDHPASNYGAARRELLDRVALPPSHVPPMAGELAPLAGAVRYGDEIGEFFHMAPPEIPTFDLVFLGVGNDGHTASLFPGQISLDERKKWVIAVKGGNPNVHRLTLTLLVLNQAQKLVFMVSGREKAEIVQRVLQGPRENLPAQLIRPSGETPSWLLDREAARLLNEKRRNGDEHDTFE